MYRKRIPRCTVVEYKIGVLLREGRDLLCYNGQKKAEEYTN